MKLLGKIIKYIKKPIGLLSDNHKRKYNFLLRLLSMPGVVNSITTRLDSELDELRTLKDPKERLTSASELVRKYPDHPLPHLELAECLHTIGDQHQFEQMDRYGEVRRDWLDSSGLGELGLEFIWSGNVAGSFGNHTYIEGLLKANQLGLRTAVKPVLLLPQNIRLRNPALFSYFEPHLCVFRDHELITSFRRLEALLTLPLGLCLPLNEGCPFIDIAANRLETERIKKDLDSAFFTLSDHHRQMGLEVIKKLGLPEDAWYVVLHVREPSYRGETPENTNENFRNANPLDYLKAIKAVTTAGGWVFRMGDPSMAPLPKMPNVIDYAHHEIKCDWMDVFLGASCRFCIGTSSGFYVTPSMFGKPVLLTNCIHFAPYYGLKKYDLFLPRLPKSIKTGEPVLFNKFMSPHLGAFFMDKHYREAGLHWIENTPEELESATREMLERTTNHSPEDKSDDDLQKHFKKLAEAYGFNYHSMPVNAFTPISKDFLERHADLLKD